MRVAKTYKVENDLHEGIRAAVLHVRGRRVYGGQGELEVTMADVVEAALRRELRLLERRYNGGKPFPTRAGPLGKPRRRRMTGG
jgi:hypothetical protein